MIYEKVFRWHTAAMQTLAGAGLIVAVSLSGCSFLFASSPPEHVTAFTTLDCTTSHVAPAFDVGLAVAEAALGGVYLSQDQSSNQTVVIAGTVFWTALYAISAGYGFSMISDCEEARAKHDALIEQEVRRSRQMPQQWAPQPPPAPPGY